MTPPTIHADELAEISGFTRRHLLRLARTGVIPSPTKGYYPSRQTLRSLFVHVRSLTGESDEKVALNRQRTAQAKLLEQKLKERDGELFERALVEREIASAFLPVRQAVDELPAEMAARCNPRNHGLARKALEVWRDEFLRAQLRTIEKRSGAS